jgi:hypothetical protein
MDKEFYSQISQIEQDQPQAANVGKVSDMYKDNPFSKKNILCCLLASLLTHVPFFSQQPF